MVHIRMLFISNSPVMRLGSTTSTCPKCRFYQGLTALRPRCSIESQEDNHGEDLPG